MTKVFWKFFGLVMQRRRQYLVLFFEENDDSRIIDSKLVRLYMNRFIIDENCQNEITGVHQLSKHRTNGSGQETTFLCEKLKKDLNIIIAAAKKKNYLDNFKYNIHFIIGTHSGVSWGWQRLNLTSDSDFRQFFLMILREGWPVKSRSCVAFTLLDGEYGRLCTKKIIQSTIENWLVNNWFGDSLATLEKRKPDEFLYRESVGDDLDLFYDRMSSMRAYHSFFIQNRSAIVQKTFLFQKLTNANMAQIGPFARTRHVACRLAGPRRIRRRLAQEHHDDLDEKFIRSDCSRMTFFV